MQGANSVVELKKSEIFNRLISAINSVSNEGFAINVEVITGFLQNQLACGHITEQQNQDLIAGFLSINELTIDSRNVSAQRVFMALLSNLSPKQDHKASGSANDGHQYIHQAINASCPLVLSECLEPSNHLNLTLMSNESATLVSLQISVFNLRKCAAKLAKAFYFGLADITNPNDKTAPALPIVTGVTGTNGKTSIASLFAQWISLLGQTSASIGTLGVNIYQRGMASKLHETLNTTPDVVSMVSYLAQLSQAGSQYIAIEASSHGLVQKRLQDIDINCAVFTNLSQDHLDYHNTMQEYGAAKRLLLQSPNLRYVVLNADDPQSQLWVRDIQNTEGLTGIQPVFFSVQEKPESAVSSQHIKSIKQEGSYCFAQNLIFTNKGCEFELISSWGNQAICLPLIGRFNVANFLAVAAALLVQSFEFSTLMQHVIKLSGVSGRMELFDSKAVHVDMLQKNAQHNQQTPQKTAQKLAEISHNKANVLVDYAHTPDALRQALIAAKQHTEGKLICVFGCGGDRDKSKRVQMGVIANEYADNIVLTQDNSRTEQPAAIIADILKGISDKRSVRVELDRKQAIKEAWLNSQAKDLVLLAGKGHETYMEIDNQRIEYDERAFVKEMFKECTSQAAAREGASL